MNVGDIFFKIFVRYHYEGCLVLLAIVLTALFLFLLLSVLTF